MMTTTMRTGKCFACGRTFVHTTEQTEEEGILYGTLWGLGENPNEVDGVCDECHQDSFIEELSEDFDHEPDYDETNYDPYQGCEVFEDLTFELWADCFD